MQQYSYFDYMVKCVFTWYLIAFDSRMAGIGNLQAIMLFNPDSWIHFQHCIYVSSQKQPIHLLLIQAAVKFLNAMQLMSESICPALI